MRRNFQRASSSSSPAIPQKKKRIVAAAKNSNFSFLSLWKCNCKSLSYFPFQVHIFFNWQPCRQMIFCNVRVLSLIRKKKYRFSGRPRSILIEYILPTTRFLKKKIALPFFKSDLSHQVLEFQNSVKYMLGIYSKGSNCHTVFNWSVGVIFGGKIAYI